LKSANQRWRIYPRMLVEENRWRAQRYGFDEGLVDFGRGRIVPYADLLDEMIALVGPDADHFGCRAEVEHCRAIVARGTSAHQQEAVFRAAKADGADDAEALRAVVDRLMEWTLEGA
jgi:glutamate---cysteine ligase / carboxylate-amine ligase